MVFVKYTEWFPKNIQLFLIALLASAFTYGYELTNFTFSIDEECYALVGHQMFFSNNRWASGIFNTLLPVEMTPFITPFLSIVFLSLASVIWARLFRFTATTAIFFCVALVSFPQFAHQMEFTFQSTSVSFAMFMAATASICLARLHTTYSFHDSFLFIILITWCIATYQSFIFLISAIFIILCVSDLCSSDKDIHFFKRAFSFIVHTTLSCILYLAITAAYTGISTGYGFKALGWTRDRLMGVLLSLQDHFSGNYFTGEFLYILVLPAALALIGHALKHRKKHSLLLVPVSSFLQSIVFGATQPIRVDLAQGIVFAFVLALFLQTYTVSKVLTFSLLALCLFYSTYSVSKLFYLDMHQLERDKALALQIATRLHSMDAISAQTPVVFSGFPENLRIENSKKNQVFGSSFFVHDKGNIGRIQAFFHYYNMMDFAVPSKQTALSLVPSIAPMPVWPHPQSIQNINGVWVVKLGPQLNYLDYLN